MIEISLKKDEIPQISFKSDGRSYIDTLISRMIRNKIHNSLKKKKTDSSELDMSFILQRIREYAKENPKQIDFADGIDCYERIIESDPNFELMELSPTIETSHEYSAFLDLDKNITLKGFYVGNVDEWLPVLMEDGFISDPKQCIVCTICPKKGTPILTMERHKNLSSGFSIDLTESFIVSNELMPIKSQRKLSKAEINQAKETIKEWNQGDFEY